MKIALYGKGKTGNRALEYMLGTDGIEIICVCLDKEKTTESELVLAEDVAGYRVGEKTDLSGITALYDRGLLDAVIIATDNELLDYAVKRLVRKGIERIAVLPSYYDDDTYDIADDSFMWVEPQKARMPYLEYHISFHCNLKCAGCTHFSNIIDSPRFGDFDSYCNDLIRLQELFWGIGKLRLMGGEPVLNPELPQFIYASRAAFPDSDIRVVSNGLMIRADQEELFEAMRATATSFDISMYPPAASSIMRIADICDSNGVKLTVTPGIHQFMARMNQTGDSNPSESYASCPAGHCSYLCNGKISTCAMPQLIDIYNDRFDAGISVDAGDVIDLYEYSGTGTKLIERLRSPMTMCRYCNSGKRLFDWHISTDPKADEWFGGLE